MDSEAVEVLVDPGPWVVTEEEQHQFFNLFNQMEARKDFCISKS